MRKIFFLSAMLFSLPVFAESSSTSIKALSFETANKLAVAAAKDCRAKGYQVAAAVVDRGGRLLSFVRFPLAGPHTVDISYKKAYTAITFQAPTSQLMELKELAFAENIILIGGGVPVNIGGYLYGAVGVSGAPFSKIIGDIDEECAQAGIDAISEDLEFGE